MDRGVGSSWVWSCVWSWFDAWFDYGSIHDARKSLRNEFRS